MSSQKAVSGFLNVHPPLSSQHASEIILKRLISKVEFLAVWNLLPNMSQWVLHTVEKGYIIQFDSQPPTFDTVLLTVKEAIELSPERHASFYSQHFKVLRKDGGSEDWFVMIDVKDKYFHISIFPQHRKYLRFSFRGKAYQCFSSFWPCTITSHYREAVLAHIKWLRLRLNSKKKYAFSCSADIFSRSHLGLD